MSMKHWTLEDPLHEIIERHLYRSSTEGESAVEMVNSIIADYLLYLDSHGVHIPGQMKSVIIEDLKEEIRALALKKTHGALSIDLNQTQINLSIPKTNRKLV